MVQKEASANYSCEQLLSVGVADFNPTLEL